jgi:hypothetical protein
MRATEADLVAARCHDVWRAKIAAARTSGIEPRELVAIACTAEGQPLHSMVCTAPGARVALDTIHPGLAASVFDDDACPPCPLGIVVTKDPTGNITSTRYELLPEAPSPVEKEATP